MTLDQPIGDPSIPLSDSDGDGVAPYNISQPSNTGAPPIDDTQNFCHIQIRRVPQIDVLTLDGGGATEFYANGGAGYDYANATGGIAVIKARRIIFTSGTELRFESSGEGFTSNNSAAGNGFLGRFSDNSYSPSNGSGGGGTLSGGGAGGGSNTGAGGDGTGSSAGAFAITNCSGPCQPLRDQKFYLGGAGGGMGGLSGSRGGGAILVYAGIVDTDSSSPNGSTIFFDAGGAHATGDRGGGAGGAVGFMTADFSNVILDGDATGGNGGTTSGGSGGGGSIEIVLCSSAFSPDTNNLSSTSVAAGTPGAGGATAGGTGDLLFTNDDAVLCGAASF